MAATESVASKIKGTLMAKIGKNESMTCGMWCSENVMHDSCGNNLKNYDMTNAWRGKL